MNRKRPQKKRGRGRKGKPIPRNPRHQEIVEFRTLIPPKTLVTLEYYAQYSLPAVATVRAYPLRPNAAYDIDPALGSTATPGFKEWAQFYAYYRVRGYRSIVTAVSNENQMIDTFVVHCNTSLGVSAGGSATDISPYAQSDRNTTRTHSVASGNRSLCVHRSSRNIQDIVGNSIRYEDNYRAPTTGVPLDTTYLLFGYKAPILTANAVAFSVRLLMDIEFYDRITDAVGSSKCAGCIKSPLQHKPQQSPIVCKNCGSVSTLAAS